MQRILFRFMMLTALLMLFVSAVSPAFAIGCSNSELITAVSSAAAGATIELATNCTYTLTVAQNHAGLPDISKNLTINGNGATITRSQASGTPNFRAIYHTTGTLTLNNFTITDFFTGGLDGAGIYTSGGTVALSGMTVSENATGGADGGGIYNNNAIVTLSNGTMLYHNGAFAGGGVYNIGASASLTVTNSGLVDNQANGQGGGLYNGTNNTTSATFINSLIYNNVGSDGGGIEAFGTIKIINSTVVGNLALTFNGGGISMATSVATVTVSNSTIADNIAIGTGENIYSTVGTVKLGSSIVIRTGNSTSGINGTIASLGYNAIGDTTGATITGTTTGNQLNVTQASLKLGPHTDNGGPTQTMALGAGSLAIGKGNCATLAGITAVTTDQRGIARKSPCDVGAYETPGVAGAQYSRIGLYNPNNALWLERYSLTTGSTSDASFLYGGINGGLALAGDWNNDGIDSPGMYVPSTAYWFLRNTNTTGTGDITFVFGGIPGALPVVGDWNGDGTDTIGLYNPSNGQWLLKNTNATGSGNADISFVFGPISGGVPIVGDWDGDGTDTVGLYVPSTGLWDEHSTNAAVGTDVTFVFGGISGGLPLVGDWNKDGKDTPGMYVPSTAYWFFRNTNNTGTGDITMVYGGIAGALPVTGHWSSTITGSDAVVDPHQANAQFNAADVTEEVTAEVSPEATRSRQANTQFTPEATESPATDVSPTLIPTALAFPTLPVNPPTDDTLATQAATDQVTPESTVDALPTALPFPTLPPPASPTDIPTAVAFPTLPSPVTPTVPPLPSPVSPPVSDPLDDGASDWAHTSGWTLAPHGSGLAWVMTSASTGETLLWQTTIDLTAQPNVSLSFASFFAGNGLAAVQISTDNGANWTAIAAISPSSDWTTTTVDLSAYTGSIIQLEFVWQASDTTVNQWGIDDVSVAALSEAQPTEAPTLAPTDAPITTEVPAPIAQPTEQVASTEAAS